MLSWNNPYLELQILIIHSFCFVEQYSDEGVRTACRNDCICDRINQLKFRAIDGCSAVVYNLNPKRTVIVFDKSRDLDIEQQERVFLKHSSESYLGICLMAVL